MNCPIVIDKTLHSKVEFVADYLNSEFVDDSPKAGSFLSLANGMLSFNSYLDDELRSLNIDFLSGPIGWRLNRSEHEKHIKKALGKSLDPLNIFDATAGMLADTMIFLSLVESFGLPLIEASKLPLHIVASELDYVRDVCVPKENFNPKSSNSIAVAVRRFLKKEARVSYFNSAEFYY